MTKATMRKTAKIHEEELWDDYNADRSQLNRNRLIEHYMPIVWIHAHKLAKKMPVPAEELCSDGVLGLIDAIEGFNPSLGFQFSTYCGRRIVGSMLDGIRASDWVPRLVRARIRKGDEIRVPKFLPIDPRDRRCRDDRPYGVAIDHVAANATRPESESLDSLRIFTRGLTRAERLCVVLYYWEDLTMRQVGESLGLSESRVSQILSRAMIRLRERPELLEETG